MFELHKDEKVILYIRRHWFFLFLDTVMIFVIFLLPVVLVWPGQSFDLVPGINLLGVSIYSVSNILIYLWALFCWMLLAEKFTDYALDFWVVTNKRIIESELIKLFDVQLSTLELQDIEDITVRSQGFIANLIGYGKLEVQTAGATNEFFADKIMSPQKVQKTIFDAKLAHEKEKMDIEKSEFEQVSKRVFKEERQVEMGNSDFDWAMIDEKQTADVRNTNEVVENIDNKYKLYLGNALRSGD